jgi:hypothetical protein
MGSSSRRLISEHALTRAPSDLDPRTWLAACQARFFQGRPTRPRARRTLSVRIDTVRVTP